MKVLADPSLCTECRICQLACSFEIAKSFNPRMALLKIDVRSEGLVAEPILCRQCENPFCLKACLSDAVSRGNDGVVKICSEKCTGCGRCAEVCPYGVIVMRNGMALKCELCGGVPRCVEACPTKALRIVQEVS